MGNPAFNLALGAPALTRQSKPPATFMGVTSRVFPLKANMYRLRKFCDAYLNVASEIAYFQPSLPFVYLMVLDYGRMTQEVANMGWVSQREVAFAIPLEWYERGDDGEWRFIDFATVCPFIYVDDEMSLSTGRQVYGWPKVKVWAEAEVNPWVYDPRRERRLLSLSTMGYSELYAAKRPEPRVFLEVRREPVAAVPWVPMSPDDRASAFSVLPEALGGYLDLFRSIVEISTQAPQLGYPPSAFTGPALNLTRLSQWSLNALYRSIPLNNITLKQFRDASHPDLICYQALVNSQIGVRRYNGAGPLGDTNLLLGDPSGGFRIWVDRCEDQPAVELLGIEVSREVTVGDESVDVLRPLFPFWIDMDLDYSVGNHICWRTKDGSWRRGNVDDAPNHFPLPPAKDPDCSFNTARSGAIQTITGPFDFPNTTLRVLPLLADPDRLDRFVRDHLKNDFFQFEAWGSWVYLVATNYEEMSSATNDIGWWADRELNFFVPVKCFDPDGRLLSVGMVSAFSFVNSGTAAITGAEVKGQPTTRAELSSPASAWMDESGPSEATDQPLLVCRTQVLPALRLGQEAELRTLLEINRKDALPYNEDVGWRIVAETWGRTLLEDHRRKVRLKQEHPEKFDAARALALEILGMDEPVNSFSLKQFRDAHDPDLACYQSVVRLRRVVKKIHDIREIEERLHVFIHELPTQPIVKTLGLVPKWDDVGKTGRVQVFQPVRPFWMKLGLVEELGEELCWRSGSETWQPGADAGRGYFEGRAPESPRDPPRVGVGVELLRKVEQGWQRLRAHCRDAVLTGGQGMLAFEAEAAVNAIDPQLVIEAILSREWEHWGNPRRYQRLERLKRSEDEEDVKEAVPLKPDLCVRTDSVVGADSDLLFAEKNRGLGGQWYSEDEWPDRPAASGSPDAGT